MSQFARSAVLAVVGLALLAEAPAFTQQPQSPPPPPPQPQSPQQPPPRFRTETNLVRVDVYATKDGVPVQDLTAAGLRGVRGQHATEDRHLRAHRRADGRAAGGAGRPSSVTAANALAADPRRRVFVIYLDNKHVGVEGSHAIKEPLIELMQRMMTRTI